MTVLFRPPSEPLPCEVVIVFPRSRPCLGSTVSTNSIHSPVPNGYVQKRKGCASKFIDPDMFPVKRPLRRQPSSVLRNRQSRKKLAAPYIKTWSAPLGMLNVAGRNGLHLPAKLTNYPVSPRIPEQAKSGTSQPQSEDVTVAASDREHDPWNQDF